MSYSIETGGNKRFVYSGKEEYRDTDSTRRFKKAYKEWQNRSRKFRKERSKNNHTNYVAFRTGYTNSDQQNTNSIYDRNPFRDAVLRKYMQFSRKVSQNALKWFIILLLILTCTHAYQNQDTYLPMVQECWNTAENKVNDFLETDTPTGQVSSDYSNTYVSKAAPSKGTTRRDTERIEQLIFDQTNELRESKGLLSLRQNGNLMDVARMHSQDMITNDYFEHNQVFFGENIGKVPIHYNVIGCGSTYSDTAIASCFMDGWINSPGHYANLINTQYHKLGVGVACNSRECVATQNFQF